MCAFNSIHRAKLQCSFADQFHLRVCICCKRVNCHDDINPELARVLNMPFKVCSAFVKQLQICLCVFGSKRFARNDLRTASVHLECAHGGDHHHDMRDEPAVTAFYVEELLHTDVGAEP